MNLKRGRKKRFEIKNIYIFCRLRCCLAIDISHWSSTISPVVNNVIKQLLLLLLFCVTIDVFFSVLLNNVEHLYLCSLQRQNVRFWSTTTCKSNEQKKNPFEITNTDTSKMQRTRNIMIIAALIIIIKFSHDERLIFIVFRFFHATAKPHRQKYVENAYEMVMHE